MKCDWNEVTDWLFLMLLIIVVFIWIVVAFLYTSDLPPIIINPTGRHY